MTRQADHDAIIAQIAAAMREQGISQSELARAVGVTQGAINQIISGATKRSKYMPEIARYLRLDLDRLLGQHGGRLVSAPEADDGQVFLTEVDMSYGMGGGTFLDDAAEHRTAVFDAHWLSGITRSPPEMLFVARGIGDSMATTLLDNDTIIIDRGLRVIGQQDRIWALTYGELGMIKRVRRKPGGQWLLMSDNPSISPIEATEDELHIVGRVSWVGRKI